MCPWQGAFWGLMFGLMVGLVRMIMEFCYQTPSCGEEDRRPGVLKDLHYLYFALILCGLTAIVIVFVSLLTPPIPEEKVSSCQRSGDHWYKSKPSPTNPEMKG